MWEAATPGARPQSLVGNMKCMEGPRCNYHHVTNNGVRLYMECNSAKFHRLFVYLIIISDFRKPISQFTIILDALKVFCRLVVEHNIGMAYLLPFLRSEHDLHNTLLWFRAYFKKKFESKIPPSNGVWLLFCDKNHQMCSSFNFLLPCARLTHWSCPRMFVIGEHEMWFVIGWCNDVLYVVLMIFENILNVHVAMMTTNRSALQQIWPVKAGAVYSCRDDSIQFDSVGLRFDLTWYVWSFCLLFEHISK